MTSETTTHMGMQALIAAALSALSYMFVNGRVYTTEIWGAATGLSSDRCIELVRIDTTGSAASRGALLAGLLDLTPPEDWTGASGAAYREWRGTLLTMQVSVTARLEELGGGFWEEIPFRPATIDRVVPVAPPVVDEPAVTGTDHRPLLALLLDERYGAAAAEPVEVTGEPGQSTAELTARYADVPGVRVVPGRPAADPEVHAAWATYARARALKEFSGHTFPNLADALTAVNLWPGRDMLEPADALVVAEQLVDASATDDARDPVTGLAAARGRLRSIIPAQLRRRAGMQVSL